MPDLKKCADCGYMGIKNPANQTELIHVGAEYRATCRSDWNSGNPFPLCYWRAFPLEDEWGANLAMLQANGTQNPHRQAAQQVLKKDRPCETWIDYVPDLSPKERAAMIPQQAALDVQQRLLDVQGKMLNLQEWAANWTREQAARERSSWWWNLLANLAIAIVSAIVSGVIAAIATLAVAGKL